MMIMMPILSFLTIRRLRKELSKQEIITLYGPLFENLNEHRDTVFVMNSIFCINRLMLGISTGLFETISVVPSIYALFGGTIFQLGFHLRFNPMKYTYTGRIEKANLVMIYFSSFSLLIFSDWVSDIEMNYWLGILFTKLLIAFCTVYGLIIIWELCIKLRKHNRKNLYEKKLEKL